MVRKWKIQSRDVYVSVDEMNAWERSNWAEIYANQPDLHVHSGQEWIVSKGNSNYLLANIKHECFFYGRWLNKPKQTWVYEEYFRERERLLPFWNLEGTRKLFGKLFNILKKWDKIRSLQTEIKSWEKAWSSRKIEWDNNDDIKGIVRNIHSRYH